MGGEHAVLKKVKGGYEGVSKKGENLGGPWGTNVEAEKRLREVECFKRNN